MTGDNTNITEYDSIAFLSKRIEEQSFYISQVSKRYKTGFISGSRARALTISAKQMKEIYEQRLKELYGRNNQTIQ